MIDGQQVTAHILSLGAEVVSRGRYLELLEEGLKGLDHHYRWRADADDDEEESWNSTG